MSDIIGRTWTGTQGPDVDWTARMTADLVLEIEWTWREPGGTHEFGSCVCFNGPEDAELGAAALDAGDDMTGWEDGTGNPVTPCAAAQARSDYVVYVSEDFGLYVAVQEPLDWEEGEAIGSYDRRNGTSFADRFPYREGVSTEAVSNPAIMLNLRDSPEDARRKEAHYDALIAPPEEVPGEDRPREVTGTGRVTSTGNSLIIKITRECDVLGIVRGDPVEYTIRRI